MKEFSKSSFKIAATSKEARLAYTGFLAFAFIGYLTLALIGLLRVGPGYRDIVIHYRGSEAEEAFPRAFGQMLEETHFHAFIEGVTLLVLTHLFIGTAVKRSAKSAVILLAFGATLSDLASPWLIRYVAPGFALLQMTSWAFIAGSALVLMGVPLYEMWWKGARR